ncbi:hypothetical protein [Microbacterium sp. NPDC096154]|uniref:hypothetical protein n=1 Tax=Microbacterium sp. NPDC096154 TaxID=3155549 RepID=UPI0033338D35
MRSPTLAPVFFATIAVLALSGCTPAPAAPDPDELRAWQNDRSGLEEGPGVLGAMTGGAAPTDAAPTDAPPDQPHGTTMAFASDVDIDSVDVTCFGEARISVEVEFTGASSGRTVGGEGVPCADGTFTAENPLSGRTFTVRVDVYDADVETAWRAIVRGAEAG